MINLKQSSGIELGKTNEWKRKISEFNELIQTKEYSEWKKQAWLSVDEEYFQTIFTQIKAVKESICKDYDYIVSCGIGGSYHGAKAFIEAKYGIDSIESNRMIYVGNNLSSNHIHSALEKVKGKSFLLVVISRSGTTFETAASYRLFSDLLKTQCPDSYNKHIVAITHSTNGKLREIVNAENLLSLPIPDSYEGRNTVLTPVGLFLLELANFNIETLCDSFLRSRQHAFNKGAEYEGYYYAAYRTEFLKALPIEVMGAFETEYESLQEWVINLFSENEGKEGRGAYLDHVLFTRELHSLGIFLQEGTRNNFETLWWFKKAKNEIVYPKWAIDYDQTNIVAGRTLHSVNKDIYDGVCAAHEKSKPLIMIEFEGFQEKELGELILFFYMSSIASSHFINIIASLTSYKDPEWGVDVYKSKMQKLFTKNKKL